MAQCIIPPRGSVVVKCYRCKTYYIPEYQIKREWDTWRDYEVDYCFEPCPLCGYTWNSIADTIPLWRYKLGTFFRLGSYQDDQDDLEKIIDSTKGEKKND